MHSLGEFVALRQGLAINKGTAHLVSEKKDENYVYPLLRIADMESGKYEKYISKSVQDSVIANEDDIVYTRTGQIGLAFRGYSGCVHNNSFIVSLTSEDIDKDYLFVLLNSKFVRQQALSLAKNSVQPDLTHDMFKSILIPVPDINEQKSIASIILTISNKILNNNTICADIEGMAKLLYDYWFVQFDFPDENGKPYKSSGGKMIWNEELKREIPDGWKVKELDDYIRIIRGVSYNPEDELKRETESSIRLLKSNNIQNGALNFEQPIILPADIANEDQWLTEGSVFITMSSGSKKHMGKTAIVFKSLPYVFGAFCAKIAIKPEYRCILSTYFRSDWFRVYIENVTAGTSINNIGQEHLTKIKLPFPPVSILSQYESIVSSLFIKQGEIIEENQELASLRDFLLPMLMNGQVKVKKGENQ